MALLQPRVFDAAATGAAGLLSTTKLPNADSFPFIQDAVTLCIGSSVR